MRVHIKFDSYGLVAYNLRRRGKDDKLGQSKVIDRASSDLTKSAVVVTVIFIVSLGEYVQFKANTLCQQGTSAP